MSVHWLMFYIKSPPLQNEGKQEDQSGGDMEKMNVIFTSITQLLRFIEWLVLYGLGAIPHHKSKQCSCKFMSGIRTIRKAVFRFHGLFRRLRVFVLLLTGFSEVDGAAL